MSRLITLAGILRYSWQNEIYSLPNGVASNDNNLPTVVNAITCGKLTDVNILQQWTQLFISYHGNRHKI